jgi:ABC-type antimicrobial peptide transport system permease subunit
LLLGLFAGIGLLLAAIGLYGVISFLVAQRTREIGVRMALGATPKAVMLLVLGHALRWTVIGASLGLTGSILAARVLQAMLFQIPARDPLALASAAAVLLATGVLAAWLAARRAATIHPVGALRQD